MARNPETIEKLRQEIATSKQPLNDFETLNNLPYLNACVLGWYNLK